MAKGGAKILFGLFFTTVLAAGLAGGGAWYLTEHRAEGYRATVELLVEPQATADAHSGMEAPIYASLFQTESVARELYEKLNEMYAGKGLTNPMNSHEPVLKAMKVETKVASQTASQVRYDPFIRLHYTADSPEVAAGAANAWSKLCLNLVYEKAAMTAAIAEDQAEQALTQLREKLDVAWKTQAELRATSPLEPLETAAVEGARALEELKATIRQLEGNAARDDAALKALKAYASKAPVAVALELSVKEADAEAALAGAKAESEYAVAKLAEVQAAQAEAQAKWAEARPRHDAADAEVDRLSEKLRSLERLVPDNSSSRNPISIASEASTPTAPVGPHRYVIVAGAAVLGALAGIIIYFGLLTLRVYARALDRA